MYAVLWQKLLITFHLGFEASYFTHTNIYIYIYILTDTHKEM